MRIVLVENAATRTKPVAKVATMPPSVPIPDSLPTIVPVWCRSRSCSLATTGATADSSPAGRITAAIASTSVAEASPVSRVASPTYRTAGSVSRVSAAPASSIGPISRAGSATRSAARPPDQAPAAIASSAAPITAVLVCKVTPTYGAISRSASVSSTSTAAAATNTMTAANALGRARDRGSASVVRLSTGPGSRTVLCRPGPGRCRVYWPWVEVGP